MAPDAVASLYMVNLDCADPRGMATFYSALLGWEMPYCEDEYSMISNGSTSIGFGRIDGYTAAPWPDEQHAKQYHLDLRVEDLAQAEATARQLGATVPAFQPGGDRWRVFLDPEGRPFCLVPTQAES
ncbi:MAG: VOC family protein [Actinomycetota bacterium]|jgi:predicted enzyme related to lactoylglutathione lyase|nr:VOC family protein [Actinomycetota bacterium]